MRAVLFGGMGYPVTETPWGLPKLKTRLEEIGYAVLLVSWKDRTEAYNFMRGHKSLRLYIGDSLGAGSSGDYPRDVDGEVDYAAGFQPSMDDNRTHRGIQVISPNIKLATCIYDPTWVDTFGLGQAHWVNTPGSKTEVNLVPHRAFHPDDVWWSQDLVFNQVKILKENNRGLD